MIKQPKRSVVGFFLKDARITASILALALFSSCQQSSTTSDKAMGGTLAADSTVTQYYTMGASMPEFVKAVNEGDFQNFTLHVEDLGKGKEGNYGYDFYSYVYKGTDKPDYYPTDLIKQVPEREKYTLDVPTKFGPLVMTKDTLISFLKGLDASGTPAEKYDSVLFVPFRDDKQYVGVKLVPIMKGEMVKLSDLQAGTVLTLNPCPPTCPPPPPAIIK